jgi:hypothetical protein
MLPFESGRDPAGKPRTATDAQPWCPALRRASYHSRLITVLKQKQVSLSAVLRLRYALRLLASDRRLRALHCDDDLSSGVAFSLITESFRKITQGVVPVDDRHQLAGFDELPENSQGPLCYALRRTPASAGARTAIAEAP